MVKANNVVIIGGGTAGVEVALELRKRDKDVNITILDKSGFSEFGSYSPCGLPYVIEGLVESFDKLVLFDKSYFSSNRIDVIKCCVSRIDRKKKAVYFSRGFCGSDGCFLQYDRLVIASGSRAFVPPVSGIGDVKYYTFKNVADARGLFSALRKGKRVLVVGAGYIGVELAYALSVAGMTVSIAEAAPHILPSSLDRDMAAIVTEYLSDAGVSVVVGSAIECVDSNMAYFSGSKDGIGFDVLVFACGVVPDIGIASDAGIVCERGIVVDDYMRTSDKYVFACGDCVSVADGVFGGRTLSMLGSSAVREAHVVAQNVLGGNEKFPEVLNASVSRIGGLVFGSAGATSERVSEVSGRGSSSLRAVSGVFRGHSKSPYFPGSADVSAKAVADVSGRLLGFQIVGHDDVSGFVNMGSFAVSRRLSVDEFVSLETCYNPAVCSAFNPLVLAAEVCRKKIDVLGKRG